MRTTIPLCSLFFVHCTCISETNFSKIKGSMEKNADGSTYVSSYLRLTSDIEEVEARRLRGLAPTAGPKRLPPGPGRMRMLLQEPPSLPQRSPRLTHAVIPKKSISGGVVFELGTFERYLREDGGSQFLAKFRQRLPYEIMSDFYSLPTFRFVSTNDDNNDNDVKKITILEMFESLRPKMMSGLSVAFRLWVKALNTRKNLTYRRR